MMPCTLSSLFAAKICSIDGCGGPGFVIRHQRHDYVEQTVYSVRGAIRRRTCASTSVGLTWRSSKSIPSSLHVRACDTGAVQCPRNTFGFVEFRSVRQVTVTNELTNCVRQLRAAIV